MLRATDISHIITMGTRIIVPLRLSKLVKIRMPTLLIRMPTIIDFYLTAVSQFTVSTSILKGRNRDTSNVDVTFSVPGGLA